MLSPYGMCLLTVILSIQTFELVLWMTLHANTWVYLFRQQETPYLCEAFTSIIQI